MGEYVDVGGLKTWYDTVGQGDPLVLLHGGLVTNDTWGMQMPVFSERFQVFAPERRAHGHTPDVEGPLTYTDMADDTIGFIETVVTKPAHLVGWSDGGIVAILVAIARPDLVRKIVPISANVTPAPTASAPEAADHMPTDPNAPEIAMFRGMYDAASPDGPEHWPVAFGKIVEMFATQPNISDEELGRIAAPTLIVSGDDDVVSLEHTLHMYRTIPGAELAVVPGTSHALPMEKADLVNRLVLDFLEKDPAPTMLPIRRAAAAH